jgi:hypothetical protein
MVVGGLVVDDGRAQTTISGYVKDSGGNGIRGVTMNGLPGNPTTDVTGNYSGTVPTNSSGIVKPQKIGYAIFPFSTEYLTIASDQTQDYTAVLLPKVALSMEPTTYNLGDPINIVMTLQNQGSGIYTSQGFMATNFALVLQFYDPDLKLITSNFGIGHTPFPPAVVPITTAEDKVELLPVEYVENVPANWVLSMPFNVLNYYTLSKGGNYSVKAKISVRAYLPGDVSQTNPMYAPHDSGSSGDIESNIINFAIISSSTLDLITINPTSSTIVAGGSQAYATRAFDVYNNSIDVTSQTQFTISPNGNCSGNICAALAAGLHGVLASYSSKTATASLQVNPGVPNKLVFSGQPSDAAVGVTISPPITVQILDSNGNLTSSTAPVTLAIGNNPGGGTLSGTKTRNAINGVATFNDLSINKVGNGYTLVASSSGLTEATSSVFNITIKTHFLIVSKVGIGSGNVTASPGTLIWYGIIGTATYNHNTTVTLTATPSTDSTFNGWYAFCLGPEEGCSVTINGSKCTLTMCGPCFANATFMLKTYTITATAGTGGSISPSGSVKVNHGANKTFTITPNTGYQILDVMVDNVSKGAIKTYTFTNVTANHTISATFKATTPTAAVRPMLECVRNNGNGTYTAYFGYLNENPVAVTITVGSNNKFTPNPQNRGQTTVFQPGRIENAFSVVFDGNNLVWYLKGPDGQGRTSTASHNSSHCK